jgi:hypothetical protein
VGASSALSKIGVFASGSTRETCETWGHWVRRVFSKARIGWSSRFKAQHIQRRPHLGRLLLIAKVIDDVEL